MKRGAAVVAALWGALLATPSWAHDRPAPTVTSEPDVVTDAGTSTAAATAPSSPATIPPSSAPASSTPDEGMGAAPASRSPYESRRPAARPPSTRLSGPRERTAQAALDLRQLRAASLARRRDIQTGILASGIASLVAGAALMIPDGDDLAWRFAGMQTAAFGAVNTIVGGVALSGIASEVAWDADQRVDSPASFADYRRHAVADEAREAWSHGVNLGLAGAYGAVGGMAVAVSQLGVDHPNRWLASGVATLVQAANLVVLDAVGSLGARTIQEKMQGISPQVAIEPDGPTRLGLDVRRSF